MQAAGWTDTIELDQATREHGEKLSAMLAETIRCRGAAISFAEFMQLALYAPGLGYYVSGMRKFGRDGDFVTAPELTPLFGRTLAHQIVEVHELTGSTTVLEIGAGSGALAHSIIEHFAESGRAVDYRILEVSPELAARQRQQLAAFSDAPGVSLGWLSDWPRGSLRGVILANEVLDALPVERFRIAGEAVQQLLVGCNGREFQWSERKAPAPLAEAVGRLRRQLPHALPSGYRSECSLALAPWVRDVCAALGAGLVLFGDYGYSRREYYAAERVDGTLICHFRHRAHADALFMPGLQDITAWVDFTAVAEAGRAAGMELAGYTTQANFLIAAGLAAEAARAMRGDIAAALATSGAIKTLTLPGEMGERFRFMGLTRGIMAPLTGFSGKNLTHTL